VLIKAVAWVIGEFCDLIGSEDFPDFPKLNLEKILEIIL